MKKIAAIVTAYNGAAYIGCALDSIAAQQDLVDDVLVIDDGSTDATREIVEAHSLETRYIYQDNQGAGAARNRGIIETDSKFIAFLDCDDEWLPGKLENQLAYLEANPEAVLVTGDQTQLYVSTGERKLSAFPPSAYHTRRLLVENLIGNPSMTLLRREPLVACGMFDAGLRWGQDWELWIRLSRYGKLGHVPGPVILYRYHEKNLSHRNQWERINVLSGISRRYINQEPALWRRPALHLAAMSIAEFSRAQYLRTRGRSRIAAFRHAFVALLSNPFSGVRTKSSELLRAVIGESLYRKLRPMLKTTSGS